MANPINADCGVGEHIKLAVNLVLKKFSSSNDLEVKFPDSFTSAERSFVHRAAENLGFASKSRGKGFDRFVTVFKKSGSVNFLTKDARLTVTAISKKLTTSTLSRNPLTSKERHELALPNDRERNAQLDANGRKNVCRAMGKLASGSVQVAVCRPNAPVKSPPPDYLPMLQTMLNNQVIFVKCDADPVARIAHVSHFLLDTSAETRRPIRIVCAVNENLRCFKIASAIAGERNEEVGQIVGFQKRLESGVSPKTLLTICNNEILLRSLMGKDSVLNSFTHIVVDVVVGKNDWFCDLLMLVLRDAANKFHDLKLIVLSSASSVPMTYRPFFPHSSIVEISPTNSANVDATTEPLGPDVDILMLCMYAKLLAPASVPIADFLAQLASPPSFAATRNAVESLKTLEALDKWEDVTEIGNHLLDFPVEPRLGKVILYATALKCLDPVLTIVACLSARENILQGSDEDSFDVRSCLADGSMSDFLALLRIFQGWQDAFVAGEEAKFCLENGVVSSTMESITTFRTLLLGHLRASGFVRSKGPGDMKDLNVNADYWPVVKAALVAGACPRLARPDTNTGNYFTHDKTVVSLDANSVVDKADENWWYTYWARTDRKISLVTAVTPISVALFAGHNRLDKCGASNASDDSDSEHDEKDDEDTVSLTLDDWIVFKTDSETARSLLHLRQKWSAMFFRKLKTPGKPMSTADDILLKTIVDVLIGEDEAAGFRQPSRVGQRPKQLPSMDVSLRG